MIFSLINFSPGRVYSWSRRDLIFLLEQLEMYVSAGLSVGQGLEIIKKGIVEGGHGPRSGSSGKKRASIEKVRSRVESGGLLSQALFDNVGLSKSLVGIVEHGERVGGLSSALKSAHDLLAKEDELIKKCLSAMTYPVVIAVLALVLTVGLMRGVVPQIVPMLTSMHVELPILTKMTIWLSGVLVSWGLLIIVAVFVVVTVTVYVYKKFPVLKKFFHSLVFRLPLIGNLIYLYSLSIFLRSLGTLINSGIPVAEAYSEVIGTTTFEPLSSAIFHGVVDVRNGLPLQDIFLHKEIPAYVAPLISAGESSGSLGESLIRAASIIDVDIEDTLKRTTSLIEPLMMVVVGGIVGAIALSIMMPIYDMSKVLQHIH